MIQKARELAEAVVRWRSNVPALQAREKEQLKREVARLTTVVVGLPDVGALRDLLQESAATLQMLEREIGFLEERHARLEEEIRTRCAFAAENLARSIETELAQRQRSLIAEELEAIQAGYAAELRAAGVSARPTTAQLLKQLPRLVEASRRMREIACERARAASERLMQTDIQAAAAVIAGRREIEERCTALLQRLAEHASDDQDGLPIVKSIQAAPTEKLAPFRKHVLLPLLADLRYERLRRLVGTDPLQSFLTSLQRSV
jgi:hypothetical protein